MYRDCTQQRPYSSLTGIKEASIMIVLFAASPRHPMGRIRRVPRRIMSRNSALISGVPCHQKSGPERLALDISEQSDVAASLRALHAPAIELRLMQPTVACRRLLGRAMLAGLDKGQGRRHKTLSRKKRLSNPCVSGHAPKPTTCQRS